MALQGTIETFALPDVMRLLASTKKSGRLRLTGSRGEGSVWVADGQIVAGDTSGPHAEGAIDVLFELLRYPDGDFVFDADELPDHLDRPLDVEPALGDAEARLAEWREIESVVPSLDSWVTLTPTLEGEEVTIDRERWALVVRIGHGTSVGVLGDQLDLRELAICRAVKDLVERGLVVVDAVAPAGFVIERRATPVAFMDEAPAMPAAEELPEDEPVPAAVTLTSVDDHIDDHTDDHDDVEPMVDFEPFDDEGLTLDQAAEGLDEPAVGVAIDTDPTDAAEIARQLANLSPKAAKAVAAAAKATTAEERERALAEVDESEDVNRDLLIKFLGSVSS